MTDTTLRDALRSFTLGEILRWDLFVGVGVAMLAAWRASVDPASLTAALPYAVGIVGVALGAVFTGTALVAATMDQAFLRKLKLIKKNPVRYVAPFMFTASIGVVAALLLVALAATPAAAPEVVLVPLAALGFGAAAWCVCSLVANLDTLVQFLGLMSDAAEVDDTDIRRIDSGDDAAAEG